MTNYEPSAEDRARIAARYPSHRRADIVAAGLAGGALLTAGALFVGFGLIKSDPPVAAMVRSFDTSEQETSATIVVQRRDPAQRVTCFVYTQADNFERVGETNVDVPPGEEELTLVNVSVRTVREATTIQVQNCRVVD